MLLCFDWSSIQAGLESIRARSISSFFKHLRPSCQKLTMHRQLPGLHCERLCHRPVSPGDTRKKSCHLLQQQDHIYRQGWILLLLPDSLQDHYGFRFVYPWLPDDFFDIGYRWDQSLCYIFRPFAGQQAGKGIFFANDKHIDSSPKCVVLLVNPLFPRFVLSYNSDYTTRCCISLDFGI